MTVSVVIPAYNAESYVSRAVSSARIAGSDEVIVVDDGSSDLTVEVARASGAKVITQRNAGAAAARDRGAEEAGSQFLIFLDADDELIPAGVANSLRLLADRPDAAAVGGLVVGLMPDGSRSLLRRSPDRDLTFAGLLRAGCGPWPPAAAVVRRSAFTRAQRLAFRQLATFYAEDYELMLRLALTGPVLSHQEPAAFYRMYVGRSSQDMVAPLHDNEHVRQYYADHFQVPVTLLNARELRAASWMRRARFERAHHRPFVAARFASVAAATRPIRTLQKICSSANTRLRS